jgi:hypothetical protein
MNGINGLREERMIFKQLFPVAYILEKKVLCNQTDFSGSGERSVGVVGFVVTRRLVKLDPRSITS